MESLGWCKKQKRGIKLVDFNLDVAKGYLKMAGDSIGTMNWEKDENLVFSVSAGYYCIYCSIYSIMQKIGVKCEIHSCSILFVNGTSGDASFGFNVTAGEDFCLESRLCLSSVDDLGGTLNSTGWNLFHKRIKKESIHK